AQHFQGHYFILQFDSSVSVTHEIKRNLRLDPRMLRFSIVKMNDNHLGRKKKGGVWVKGVESGGGVSSGEAKEGSLVWKEGDVYERMSSGGGGGYGGAGGDRSGMGGMLGRYGY
ncbi:uncharacterized protein AB675_1709, partial [Cyphellophora attinorum]